MTPREEPTVDRRSSLRERRQTAEERHDTIHAFTYDERYGEIGPVHRRFVADLLERCPPGGVGLRDRQVLRHGPGRRPPGRRH
jgi:hypothetical protein